jgi:hypothetical protein
MEERKTETKEVITLDNDRIRGFFEAHPYIEPTRFVLSCIAKFQEHMFEDETTHVVKHDVLMDLKEEFQTFLYKKQTCIRLLKSFYREELQLMENTHFPALEMYLKSKFAEDELGTEFANLHQCINCARASFPSKKALAVHQRYCIDKISETMSSPDGTQQTDESRPAKIDT